MSFGLYCVNGSPFYSSGYVSLANPIMPGTVCTDIAIATGAFGGGWTAIPAFVGCVSLEYAVQDQIKDVHHRYVSSDDHRLLAKLGGPDCGGLSKMSANVESCFKKYVSEAICRQAHALNFPDLKNLFEQCFVNRPHQECGDWFFRTDVF